MNDSGEFELALGMTQEIVTQRIARLSDNEDRHILEKGLARFRSMRLSNICSVSFCEKPDLLSQWRGYAENGVGYAIGFSAKALSSIGEGDPVQCIYDCTDQEQIINELVDDILVSCDIENRADHLIGGFGNSYDGTRYLL